LYKNNNLKNMKSEIYQHLKNLSNIHRLHESHQNYLIKIRDKLNFNPRIIYDIGACVLQWTNSAKLVWPDSKYFLFDAMEESEELFIESGYDYHIGVLGDRDGKEVTFYKNVYSPGGNSYYMENQEYSINANNFFGKKENQFKRNIETLDTICFNNKYPPPDLLKIDVQGCEIDILNGAKNTIKETKHLIVELQHVQYNIGAKMVSESIPIIESMGFKLIAEKFSLSSHADADYHFINKNSI